MIERYQRPFSISLACAAGVLSLGSLAERAVADPVPARLTEPANTDFDGTQAVPIGSEPSGYVIGNAFQGNSVDIAMPSDSGDSQFGLIGSSTCGWIESDTLNKTTVTSSDSPCRPFWGWLKNRRNFGRDFNGPDSKFVSGTFSTPISNDCNGKAYFNYAQFKATFNNINYPSGDSGFTNFAGLISTKASDLHYRYTTLDGEAALLKDDSLGWVFIDRSCVIGHPRGGPQKTADAAPGAHPLS